MGRQINLYEAKTQLSRLVEDAARGDTIIIAKDGKPMAKLGPVAGAKRRPRELGQLSERAKEIDWVQWWREWKASDKQIQAEFERAISKPLVTAPQRPRRKRH